jgi:hypothetical protein
MAFRPTRCPAGTAERQDCLALSLRTSIPSEHSRRTAGREPGRCHSEPRGCQHSGPLPSAGHPRPMPPTVSAATWLPSPSNHAGGEPPVPPPLPARGAPSIGRALPSVAASRCNPSGPTSRPPVPALCPAIASAPSPRPPDVSRCTAVFRTHSPNQHASQRLGTPPHLPEERTLVLGGSPQKAQCSPVRWVFRNTSRAPPLC